MAYPTGRYSDDTLALQRALIIHGFDVGKAGADGKLGNDTIKAIGEAREAFALPGAPNLLDVPLLVALGVRNQPQPKGTPMNNILGSIFTGLAHNFMRWDLIQGYLRSGLLTLGGWIGLDGLVGAEGSKAIIGAVMVILGVLFSALSNNQKVKAMDVVKAIDAHPLVTVIPASETASHKPVVQVNK